ncbi:ImmA/IrrE family metallo-endopeptidase [Haloferula sp. A504]|uniref:ImmA/IrrE family metallo-endopeptidase n=1 Tax=Haloferula sp. A504 TaxID=3373601 RepID=UPI0031CA95B1|nr:ImmA/IrrE family metallo-endopeptidase [Verrucomicrobiaceae bacterium E54]
MKITLQPEVLAWARDRGQLSREDLAKKVGTSVEKVAGWEEEGELTWKQAEKVAAATRTPFGYLFLESPPEERLPIPDFRTHRGRAVGRPSPDLIDVLHQSLRRQDWFRDYLVAEEEEPLGFVNSVDVGQSPERVATAIRRELGFHPSESTERTLEGVLNDLCAAIEAIGILVVRAGIVGNATRRKLDPEEFRGFALVDEYAPLIFVNAADFKAAQIFTLIHEVVHLWVGQSAIFNLENTYSPRDQRVEAYCNAVAAEYLVPIQELRELVQQDESEPGQLVERLRRRYRVSDLVIIRRLHDIGQINRNQFKAWYEERLDQHADSPRASGGDFYRNQPGRIGPRFSRALVASTLEGRTLIRDALSLLGFSKVETFRKFASELKFSV